jgi:hypothetical protein
VSDLYVVMCKTNENEVSVLLVEKGMKGTQNSLPRPHFWQERTQNGMEFVYDHAGHV